MTIDLIYREKRFIAYCRKLTKATGLHDDLLQHCAIAIVEQKVLEKINNPDELFGYFCRIAYFQWSNPYKAFSKTHRVTEEILMNPYPEGHDLESVTDDFIWQRELQAENPFYTFMKKDLDTPPPPGDKAAFVEKEVMHLCLRYGSIRKACAAAGLDFNHVRKVVNNYATKIKTQYEQYASY